MPVAERASAGDDREARERERSAEDEARQDVRPPANAEGDERPSLGARQHRSQERGRAERAQRAHAVGEQREPRIDHRVVERSAEKPDEGVEREHHRRRVEPPRADGDAPQGQAERAQDRGEPSPAAAARDLGDRRAPHPAEHRPHQRREREGDCAAAEIAEAHAQRAVQHRGEEGHRREREPRSDAAPDAREGRVPRGR